MSWNDPEQNTIPDLVSFIRDLPKPVHSQHPDSLTFPSKTNQLSAGRWLSPGPPATASPKGESSERIDGRVLRAVEWFRGTHVGSCFAPFDFLSYEVVVIY